MLSHSFVSWIRENFNYKQKKEICILKLTVASLKAGPIPYLSCHSLSLLFYSESYIVSTQLTRKVMYISVHIHLEGLY